MPQAIDIVGDEMVVLDEDANGCDCRRLVRLRAAKRQLRLWQDEYTFDYVGTLSAVSEFFHGSGERDRP